MSDVKLLRGNTTLAFAYPEAVADWATPTTAELNNLFAYGTNEGGMVFNVSCAIVDGYTLGMTDPETDATRTICDVGNVENPTNDTYEGSMEALRDLNVDADGVFNMARDLTLGPDRRLWVIERIGAPSNAEFEVGQVISMYEFSTDWPDEVIDDNTPIQHGIRFKPTGNLHTNYIIKE